ncbi:MAG: alpha/beta fold hydrolase [Planctomycetales bacterium]|nr:alpha/beta fold hydrolase [Planctomycetales bacterium]
MSDAPSIHYVRTGDGADIAYWTLGRGPVLLHSPNVQLGHLHAEWSVEAMRRWYETLAQTFTVVRYDHRGGGLSSRGAGTQSIDELVDDIEAVAAKISPEPFVLLGWLTGGLPAIAYSARRPKRISHLVLWNSFARNVDHGEAPRMRSLFEMAATDWELFTESISHAALGWQNANDARQWAAVGREATTQAEFLDFLTARRDWDVTTELEKVKVGTLVMYDQDNALASEDRSRELAAGIPGAQFLVCDSEGGTPDADAIEAIRSFVGLRARDVKIHLDELTVREREVLSLVVEGTTNAEIAKRLFISIDTVTRHLTHIYAKTGTKRRVELVRYALERGSTSK